MKHSKNSTKNNNTDAQNAELSALRDKVERLEGICKALSFVMPSPTKDIEDCLTHTELYKVQFRMAKNLWTDYINSK